MKEALTQTLGQHLQQRLAPMQMRLVKLLEMTGPEIEDEVQRQLDDNPALAVTADNESDIASGPVSADENATAEANQVGMVNNTYVGDDYPTPYYRIDDSRQSGEEQQTAQQTLVSGETLIDSIMSQLAETDIDPRSMAVARYIAGNIDGNGYVTRTLREIQDDLAFNTGTEVEMPLLKEIFSRIRQCEPAGVCAVDLRDCLLLQLQRLPCTPSVETALRVVRDYFDIYSLRHFDRLSALMGTQREQLKEADEVIRSLDPKPGSTYGQGEIDNRIRHIVPDFVIDTDQNGRVVITMPSHIPSLTIEKSFDINETLPTDSDNGTANPLPSNRADQQHRQALAFISRKRNEASEFIELLKMRRDTLMRVMEAILKWQAAFFATEEDSSLRPMVLKDISAVTGLDISVISRATAGKYVATGTGIYPLKFFFNEGVAGGGDISQREIISALKSLIDEEDPGQPLSDDILARHLQEAGYDVARRTVAKYRERLGLPVARLRKKA